MQNELSQEEQQLSDEVQELEASNVEDDGIGMSPEFTNQLFEMFDRRNDDQANGSGLGLAIVARIAKSYQGRLHLKNRKGGGLIVQVAFPLAEETVGQLK